MTRPPGPEKGAAPASAAATARSAVWTRHWASGVTHSCAGSYGDRYGGAIAGFWKTLFEPLHADCRVLDLATGNGALPRLLLDLVPELPVTVDAIDLAQIEPAWLSTLPSRTRGRIRFHGGAPIEALAFADASFDLIVSQYGIEYSDLDRSMAELLRVLAPGGRVALLVHVVDSRPVTLAAVELAHLDWLQSEQGLLPACAAMIDPINRARTPHGRASLALDRAAESARERFNSAQAGLRHRRNVPDGADVLFEMQDALAAVLGLAAQHGVDAARSRLNAVELAIDDLRLRLQQLCDHALPRARLSALHQTLRAAMGGRGNAALGELREHGYLMGCTLVATAADNGTVVG